LIGCGSIGTVIAKAIDDGTAGKIELTTVYDIILEKAEHLVKVLKKKPIIAKTPDEILNNEKIQIVIEAASQEAVRQYSVEALSRNKDLMPSGAIVGLDNIKAASLRHIDEITLVTRKPPSSFAGAPLVEKKKIDLRALNEPVVLFEGPARQAVKMFPKNVNVSASLSLAGIGPDRTKVRIIADPNVKVISHEIHVKGDFGELNTKTVNKPFPKNPKTSYIAALSAIATLKKISGSIVIGT